MKRQIVCIHGGDAYETYEEYLESLKSIDLSIEQIKKISWKNKLQENLGEDYDVLLPQMPCKWNSRYVEWKIWFDKIARFIEDDAILIGHSMGGIFLAKYLSENVVGKKIAATILIAAPFDEKGSSEKLVDFNFSTSLEKFKEQAGKIILIQSEDDPVVPFADMDKYIAALPEAERIIFKDRQHFSDEEFPEIIEIIKKI